MQSADFLSAVFFYLKEGENLNQNWIVENLNNAFSTWNGKLGELWGLVTTGPHTFKGGAVWSVMQTLHNGMVGIAMFHSKDAPERPTAAVASDFAVAESFASLFATAEVSRTRPALMVVPSVIVRIR